MGTRIQLQSILENVLGSRNVYFQPPESIKISYPCIIYKRDDEYTNYANDSQYHRKIKYQIMIIDKSPDSDILGKIASLPMCSFGQHYTSDNLNHDIYNIYY